MSDFAPIQSIPLDAHGNPINAAMVRYGSDSALAVKFWFNEAKGRDYIEIILPGGKTVVNRRAEEDDKARFWAHWQQYQMAIQGHVMNIGTPLDKVDFLNEWQVAELKGKRITTVEQLAAMNDQMIQSFGPGTRDLVIKAKLWFQRQDEQESADLKQQVADLKAQVAELMKAKK